MQKIYLSIVMVLSCAFGTIVAASEDLIPSELTETQKLSIKYAFCEPICDDLMAFAWGGECHFVSSKWNFLKEEVFSVINKRLKQEGIDWNNYPLKEKFLEDLRRAKILDDFYYTEKHIKNCVSEWETIYNDNYKPTFNIELLK